MKGICLDSTYDVNVQPKRNSLGLIVEGMVVGETIYQNEALILVSHTGEFKENPMLGVGVNDMVNDNDIAQWEHAIRVNLSRDNMEVRTVKINRRNGNITIEADYK